MKVKCDFCNREVEEQDVKYRLTVGGRTLNYCGLGCLYSAEPLADIRHVSLSSMVLNKTFFEFLAIVTGIGGSITLSSRLGTGLSSWTQSV